MAFLSVAEPQLTAFFMRRPEQYSIYVLEQKQWIQSHNIFRVQTFFSGKKNEKKTIDTFLRND